MNRQMAFVALVVVLMAPAAHGQAPLKSLPQAAQPVAPASPPPAPLTQAAPTIRVAVVDVGEIFKKHKKFKEKMDKMKEEVLAAENKLKQERDQIASRVEQLKGLNVGTPDYRKLEAEVAKAQGDFNVNAQLQKKDFMEREAKVYLEVYQEIEANVKAFAQHYQIDIVHRFDGEPIDPTDRNRILGGITKPIVYYSNSIDITKAIIKMIDPSADAVAAAPSAGGKQK